MNQEITEERIEELKSHTWMQDEDGMFYYQLDPETDSIPGRMYADLPGQLWLKEQFGAGS